MALSRVPVTLISFDLRNALIVHWIQSSCAISVPRLFHEKAGLLNLFFNGIFSTILAVQSFSYLERYSFLKKSTSSAPMHGYKRDGTDHGKSFVCSGLRLSYLTFAGSKE